MEIASEWVDPVIDRERSESSCAVEVCDAEGGIARSVIETKACDDIAINGDVDRVDAVIDRVAIAEAARFARREQYAARERLEALAAHGVTHGDDLGVRCRITGLGDPIHPELGKHFASRVHDGPDKREPACLDVLGGGGNRIHHHGAQCRSTRAHGRPCPESALRAVTSSTTFLSRVAEGTPRKTVPSITMPGTESIPTLFTA